MSIFTCPCMAVTASFTHTSPTLTCSLHERGASIISVVMSAARNTRSDKLLSLLPGDAAESRPLPASCLLPPASAAFLPARLPAAHQHGRAGRPACCRVLMPPSPRHHSAATNENIARSAIFVLQFY